MTDAWVATYRVILRNMCEHDEPNAENLVKDVLNEEGVFSCADLDDMELISLERLEE